MKLDDVNVTTNSKLIRLHVIVIGRKRKLWI